MWYDVISYKLNSNVLQPPRDDVVRPRDSRQWPDATGKQVRNGSLLPDPRPVPRPAGAFRRVSRGHDSGAQDAVSSWSK